ncbi:MAG: MBL fold metallo-hydrolase [Hyphomicrobiales bacterium]
MSERRRISRRSFIRRFLGLAALAGFGTGAHAQMSNPYYAGPVTDHFDGTRFFVPGHEIERGLSSVYRMLTRSKAQRAPWPDAIPSPFADTPPARSEDLRVTLIGHASFLIQVAGLNLLIDPVYAERASPFQFIGPTRRNPPGIAMDKLPPIDAVLVSHSHYDHMDVAALGEIAKWHKARFIAPLGNDTIMGPAAGTVETFDWGQSIDLGQGVSVHLLPSFHWAARGVLDRRKSLWGSFVFTTPAGTIYHIADTGYGDGSISLDMKAKFGAPRLAIIPIGAYEPRWFMQSMHVNPAEAVQIFQDCGAEAAIGHHWGTFHLTDEAHDKPEQDLAIALAAAGIAPEKFKAFRPGQVWRAGSDSA